MLNQGQAGMRVQIRPFRAADGDQFSEGVPEKPFFRNGMRGMIGSDQIQPVIQ